MNPPRTVAHTPCAFFASCRHVYLTETGTHTPPAPPHYFAPARRFSVTVEPPSTPPSRTYSPQPAISIHPSPRRNNHGRVLTTSAPPNLSPRHPIPGNLACPGLGLARPSTVQQSSPEAHFGSTVGVSDVRASLYNAVPSKKKLWGWVGIDGVDVVLGLTVGRDRAGSFL